MQLVDKTTTNQEIESFWFTEGYNLRISWTGAQPSSEQILLTPEQLVKLKSDIEAYLDWRNFSEQQRSFLES